MDNELRHFGILGQKWGVRRFQKKDGKKRAKDMSDEDLQSFIKRKTLEKTYTKLDKESVGPSTLQKTKKVVDAGADFLQKTKKISDDLEKTHPKTRLDLSAMSDQSLRERINRENMERQYNDLFAERDNVSRGQVFLKKTLDGVGTGLMWTGSALAIALAIKELREKSPIE